MHVLIPQYVNTEELGRDNMEKWVQANTLVLSTERIEGILTANIVSERRRTRERKHKEYSKIMQNYRHNTENIASENRRIREWNTEEKKVKLEKIQSDYSRNTPVGKLKKGKEKI